MLYILTSRGEMAFSKIWRGHLLAIRLALAEHSYTMVDVDERIVFGPEDTVINIGNHQYLGSEVLNNLAAKIKNAGKTVFFMDDYTAPPPTQIRKALTGENYLVSCAFDPPPQDSLKIFTHFQHIDMNRASYDPVHTQWNPRFPGACIYWGIFRSKRLDSYYKYFKPSVYTTFVSTSPKQHEKYIAHYLNYAPLDKLNIPKDLQDYGFTIYLEDKASPFHSLSNRFYEALSAGLPMFFDASVVDRVPLPEYGEKYVISEPESVLDFHFPTVSKTQNKLWSKDYLWELVNDLKNFFERSIV